MIGDFSFDKSSKVVKEKEYLTAEEARNMSEMAIYIDKLIELILNEVVLAIRSSYIQHRSTQVNFGSILTSNGRGVSRPLRDVLDHKHIAFVRDKLIDLGYKIERFNNEEIILGWDENEN